MAGGELFVFTLPGSTKVLPLSGVTSASIVVLICFRSADLAITSPLPAPRDISRFQKDSARALGLLNKSCGRHSEKIVLSKSCKFLRVRARVQVTLTVEPAEARNFGVFGKFMNAS
jgi:hypothetical protein